MPTKKPILQVEKELEAIFDLWPRPFIELADDNTFVDKKWSAALLQLFSRYKMKWFTECDISIAYDDALLEQLARSGCAQVLIGFETTYKEGLQGLDKANWKYKQWEHYQKSIEKIQSYGISVNGCFIFGFDTDNAITMAQTEAFIKESKLSEVRYTRLSSFNIVTLTLMPICVIITTLFALNLHGVVFQIMGGLEKAPTPHDASYAVLMSLTIVSVLLVIPLLIAYGAGIAHQRDKEKRKKASTFSDL